MAHLPDPVNDIARFAHSTGWRKGEVLPLRWEQVDRAAGEIRLRTSKNGHGRVLRLTSELAELIERRWAMREYKKDGVTHISEFVSHQNGDPVADFRNRWAGACKQAKVPGRIFHDLRRTAVRNMVRAGVPETVAMAISGHRTRSMFDRYNIMSTADLWVAIARTQDYLATLPTERDLAQLPTSEAKPR